MQARVAGIWWEIKDQALVWVLGLLYPVLAGLVFVVVLAVVCLVGYGVLSLLGEWTDSGFIQSQINPSNVPKVRSGC